MIKRRGNKRPADGRESEHEVRDDTGCAAGPQEGNEPAGEEILLEAIRLLPEDVLGQVGDEEEIVQQGEKKRQKLRLLKWAAVAAVILLVLAIAWKSGVYPFGETNKQKQSISVEESSEAVQ